MNISSIVRIGLMVRKKAACKNKAEKGQETTKNSSVFACNWRAVEEYEV